MGRKRKKKKSVFPKVVLVLLVLVVLAFGAYGYLTYSPIVSEKKNDILEIDSYIKNEMFSSNEVYEKIVFPTKLEGFDGITLNWKSSNTEVINELGEVSLPSYSDGDKKVTLTTTYTVEGDNPLFNIFWNILGGAHETVVEVIVKSKTASALEKVNLISAGIYVPEYTTCSIGLLTEDKIFSSVSILWQSSNLSVISNDGEKCGVGSSKLIATLTCEDVTKVLEFDIEVGDEKPILTDLDVSFDNHSKGSYNGEYEKDNIKFVNSLFVKDEEEAEVGSDSLLESFDKVVRLKATDDASAYFYTTKEILNPKYISFRYGLIESDSSKINKDSYLTVYISTDLGESWVELSKEKLTSKKINYFKEINITGSARIKVEFSTSYSELRLDLDDFKVERYLNEEDVEREFVSRFSTKFTTSRVLPLTTLYGGIVEWSSDKPNYLDQFGNVYKELESQKVVLTAKILGFEREIIINFDITIPGKNAVLPVEIYFIDLGKYGLSDCGESILIKYGSIDVLIDAGDDIKTSNQAIKEAIDTYSEDKVFEYVIATHPDSDHIGGMPFIFENYEVQNLIQFNGDHTSNLYKEYVNSYLNEECGVCTALDSFNNENGCNRIIELGSEVYIEILNTQNYEGKETNTRSIVCILNAYGVRTLLTGDADNGSNSNLENDYKDTVGDIDILKAVHHGTANGTTTSYLEAVDPETVIICNGNYLGNKHGHPSPDAINRIYKYDSTIEIYTIVGGDSESCEETSSGSYKCDVEDGMVDRNGTIKVTINESGYVVTSEYFGETPLEFSSTNYWKTNPLKEYSYQN